MALTIPAGTHIYLSRYPPYEFYIQPDQTILNVTMYVKYDVRVNGITIIPRGTRVTGDWVTESTPTVAAQFQLSKIFLTREGQKISADSRVIEATSLYNDLEVENAKSLSKIMTYRSTANINRRIVDVLCQVKTLLDNDLNTTYLQIFTKELPVVLTSGFTPRYDFC